MYGLSSGGNHLHHKVGMDTSVGFIIILCLQLFSTMPEPRMVSVYTTKMRALARGIIICYTYTKSVCMHTNSVLIQ